MPKRLLPAVLLGCAAFLTGAVLSPLQAAHAQVAPAAAVIAHSDPSSAQIYAVARAGDLAQARAMVEQVLRDYPANGKAHYVAAEVYARSGDLSRAREELNTAQNLSPGLPFASATSVTQLEQQLASGHLYAVPGHRGISWGGVVLVIGLVALIYALLRRRTAVVNQYGAGQPGVYPGANPYGPYPNVGSYGPGGMSTMGAGSGLMGSLATGMAVGAGVAAGEALVGRTLGGGVGGSVLPGAGGPLPDTGTAAPNADMGGQDFGLNDAGSWNDGAAGDSGGGDWGGGDMGGGGGGDMGGGGDWT